MEMFTRGIGLMEKEQEKENILGMMGMFTREIL